MAGKKIRFINPNAAPPKAQTAWSNFVSAWRKVQSLLAFFVAIVICCAVLFYFGTPHGWGIRPTFAPDFEARGGETVTFFDCLHFSIVTIATLGYGDFSPESYGRLIAGAEVVAGIILMGVFVSRLVSSQQDRMTKRLVRGQINAELQDFRDQLSNLLKAFSGPLPAIGKNQPSEALHNARGLAMSIARYWRHEAKEPDLAEVLPLRASGRLLGELIELLEGVVKCCEEKTKSDLHPDDFKAVRSITESTLTVAVVLADRVPDEGIRHSHARVTVLVASLRQQLQLQ